MNNSLMAKGMLITFAELGVKIDKFDETDRGVILYMSVPKTSYEQAEHGDAAVGGALATKVKKMLSMLGTKFADCRYKIRDEHLTKEMAEMAKIEAKKDMGLNL